MFSYSDQKGSELVIDKDSSKIGRVLSQVQNVGGRATSYYSHALGKTEIMQLLCYT